MSSDISNVKITKEDVLRVLGIFRRVPTFILRWVVYINKDVVSRFADQLEDYGSSLDNEDRLKIRKLVDMPVSEIQKLLQEAYEETDASQFEILASGEAAPFLKKNLKSLKKLLFNNKDKIPQIGLILEFKK